VYRTTETENLKEKVKGGILYLFHAHRALNVGVPRIFCRYSADMKENANKLHFKCTDFDSSTLVTVYAECIYVFRIFEIFRHTKA